MKSQFTRIVKYLHSPTSSAESADLWSRQAKSKGHAHRQRPTRNLAVNLWFGFGCGMAAVATLVSSGDTHAQSTDDFLRIYAVNIIQEPPQPWIGYGSSSPLTARPTMTTSAHSSSARIRPPRRSCGVAPLEERCCVGMRGTTKSAASRLMGIPRPGGVWSAPVHSRPTVS
jgi:hypothetical protein